MPVWPRAHGSPLFSAQLRSRPEDFQVIEHLGWEPSGDGEHDFLYLTKIGANTDWVARQLAQFAGVPAKDVGFAGLKDRHAVTQQWFSVPRWHSPDWEQLSVEGVTLLQVDRHLRKLRRGAHKTNAFCIQLRSSEAIDKQEVHERCKLIRAAGVPNYFGEQRFGRNAGNLKLAEDWACGRRLSRQKRSLAISVMRSFCFNEALACRVRDGSWNYLLPGDKANLDGSASVFEVSEIDDELRSRCKHLDIHPSGVLAGEGTPISSEHWQAALRKARVQEGERSLRLRVQDLHAEVGDAGVTISFELGRGAFATSLLRELCSW
ncbi:MAG: tRNA pseudouridine(13) synthase TruD [Pseudomonadota bacterium]